jgi:hypothetical protein
MALMCWRISIILIVVACAIDGLPGRAQTSPQGASFKNPLKVNLEALVRKSFASFFKKREEIVPEGFYPIGWSKDGKFAYYLEPVDEACDCYFAKLFIVDLKSDKVLWSFDYNSESIDDAKQAKKPYTLATLWQDKRELFSGKLKEYAIQPQGRFAVQPFPINYGGDQLTADLTLKEKEGANAEDARLYGVINKATLQLISKHNGKKTISEMAYTEAMPLDVKVLGYLQSPFEPRIAVILLEAYRGYEGPPHVGAVKVAGASLTGGFK